MPFDLSNLFIIRMYENLREEARDDAFSGTRPLADPAKRGAQQLRWEIDRRGAFCVPTEWPAK